MSANFGFANRSGDTSSTSTRSSRSAWNTSSQSSKFDEFTDTATKPEPGRRSDLITHQRQQR